MVNILLNKIKQDPVMTVNIQLNPKGLKRNRLATVVTSCIEQHFLMRNDFPVS